MKKLFTCIAASLLWTGTAFGQETADAPAETGSLIIEEASIQPAELQPVPEPAAPNPSINSAIQKPQKGSDVFEIYAGVGPAFDLRDPAYGYSAKIGMGFHDKYFGVGAEVSWNTQWSACGTKRSDHNDTAYRATNSGVMAMMHGFIPLGYGFIPGTDRLSLKLGAGIGLGWRYESIFSDIDKKVSDGSWLARLQAGVVWQFDNDFTVGADMEFNFGNYVYTDKNYWSDDVTDISLGLVLTVSYQWFMN